MTASRLALLVPLCALLAAPPADALTDAQHQSMMRGYSSYAQADSEMNIAWRELRAALGSAGLNAQFDGGTKPPHRDSLLASQRGWLARRDAEAERLRAGGSEVDGYTAAMRERTAFLRERIEALSAFAALPAPAKDAPFMQLLKKQGGRLRFDTGGAFSSYVEFDADGTARVGITGRPDNLPSRWKLLPDGRVRVAHWEGAEDYALEDGRSLTSGGDRYLLAGSDIQKAAEGQAAAAPGATLVEVRHAPAEGGKTPVVLKAVVPLTLTFHELDYANDGPKVGQVTASHQLAAGETRIFSHEQPFDVPVQAVCAQPQQGARMCWFPQDNEEDDGGRFIMAPGFVLKN